MAKAKARLKKLLGGGLVDRLCAKVDELGAIVAQTEELSNTKFPRSTKVGEEITNYATYAEALEQLKTYLKTRFKTVEDLTVKEEQSATAKIDQVTYKPENAWWNTELGTGQMGKITDVQVENRTFKAGIWNTFCMPFDLSMDQMKTVFGEGVEVVSHDGMDIDAKTMLFAPIEGETLYAATPYLVKFTGSDVVNPTFKDVIITQTALQQKQYNGNAVTYDGKHYFYGTLFLGYNIDTTTDYLFGGDAYTEATSINKASQDNEKGARAFLRVPAGEVPQIKILSAEEAQRFDYEVDNVHIHDIWKQREGKMLTVTLKNRKTIYGNEWNMICLPFKLKQTDIQRVFGEDVKVVEFSYVSLVGDQMQMNFDFVTDMKAATPYMIMPSKDVSNLVFDNVLVSTKEAQAITPTGSSYSLVGVLSPVTLTAGHGSVVLLRNNLLSYVPKECLLHGCRAYIACSAPESAAKALSLSIDGEVTAIQGVMVQNTQSVVSDKVYNLNGQCLGVDAVHLPKGVYIVKGHKIIK